MDVNPELESFREQWRAEVRARNPAAPEAQQHPTTGSHGEASGTTAPASRPPRPAHLSSGKPRVLDTDEDYVETRTFDAPDSAQLAKHVEQRGGEPVTALEHYERAVEKEEQGSLGDSLDLYRRAFRVRKIPC